VKALVGRTACAASPRDAWYALRGYHWWLSPREVATFEAADIGEHPGYVAGRPVVLLLFDERHLRCRIVALDQDRRMTVSVRWRRAVNAELTLEITPAANGCELVHRRSYRGLVTRYLASVWRVREEEEQDALLRDWCWEAGTIAAQRRYAV
jgi:hypothetical protein